MCISAGSIEVYAEDEMYALRPLRESDRGNYMRAVRANSTMPGAYNVDGYEDFVWSSTPENAELIFCIIDKETGAHCGHCNLRHCDTATPEVGISLLPEFQGKGIGVPAIRLMIDVYRKNNLVDYFVARVDSGNTKSLRVMEKLGAVQYGTEDCEFKQAMDRLQELIIEKGGSESDLEMPESYDSYIRVFRLE